MPFIGSVGGSRSGRLFSIGAKPAVPGAPSLSAGDATDTFSWSAPNNNGVPITKYGYQTSTDGGSTWSAETETASTYVILNTQYSLSSYKIKVRAFNAVGWSDYSTASSGTVAWTSNTGTDTQNQSDTGCGPAGCSQSQSDTSCSDCSETQTQNCECGTQSRTRTRSRSRSRSRSRGSSRTRSRSRSTQYWSRSGSTSSSITYGSWTISDYEWNLAASSSVGWSAFTYTTYPEWSTISFSACADGTNNYVYWADGRPYVPSKGVYTEYNLLAGGHLWCDANGNYLYTCGSGSGLLGPTELYQCNTTGTYTYSGETCYIISCC